MSRIDSVSRYNMITRQIAVCMSAMLMLFAISVVVGCSNGLVGDESVSKTDNTKQANTNADDAKTNTDEKKDSKVSKSGKEYPKNPRELTDAQWRERLTAMQYKVARKEGTERAFTGELWDNKKDGVYVCVCCGEPLFDSKTKYESGTGWPSFWKPIDNANVGEKEDYKLFSRRVEVTCANCDAHLGHVFEDGPQPTGLRYCLNSAALDFEEREAPVEDEKKSSSSASSSNDEGSE